MPWCRQGVDEKKSGKNHELFVQKYSVLFRCSLDENQRYKDIVCSRFVSLYSIYDENVTEKDCSYYGTKQQQKKKY